jgi:hypothetical protein
VNIANPPEPELTALPDPPSAQVVPLAFPGPLPTLFESRSIGPVVVREDDDAVIRARNAARNAAAQKAEDDYAEAEKKREAAIAEAARQTTEVVLTGRVAAETIKRNLSLEAPEVPGTGWGSSEVQMVMWAVADNAKARLRDVAQAQEALAAGKRAAAAKPPNVLNPGRDLAPLRDDLDIFEERFRVAYEELEAQRAKLRDPEFIAKIEQLNEATAAGALHTPYVTKDDPEMAQIAQAIRTMFDAFRTITRRHESKIQEHAAATVLARTLGISMDRVLGSDRYHHGVTNPQLGKMLVVQAIEAEAEAWQKEHGRIEVTDWLPHFDYPW